MKKALRLLAIFTISVFVFTVIIGKTKTYATESSKTITVPGTRFIFGAKSSYDFSSADETFDTGKY